MSTRTPTASIRASTGASGRSICLVKFGETQLFHFRAQQGREPQQKIRALAWRAGKRAIQMAQNNLGKSVIRGGGPQKIGIKHGGVANARDGIRVAGR